MALSGAVSKDTIDYLGKQIRTVENAVLAKGKLRREFAKFQQSFRDSILNYFLSRFGQDIS